MTQQCTDIPPSVSGRPKLMDQLRRAIQVRHYRLMTEHTYCYWVRYYIRFHNIRHPAELTERHVAHFLSYLVSEKKVSAATQNQALNAINFFYKHVLGRPLGKLFIQPQGNKKARHLDGLFK